MAVNRELADNLPLVIDYLERNPNIFLYDPTLLSKLNLPHINGRNVSSLIEYQVDHLRKNEQLLNIQIKKLNYQQQQCDKLANEAYKLAAELSEINSIEVLYNRFFHFLRREYQCNYFMIFLFCEKRPYPDYRDLRFKPIHSKIRYLFSGLYNVNKPLCDSLPAEYIDALFGNESTKIKSTVTLPIKDDEMPGLFILGSQQYNTYENGFSIHLLNHLKTKNVSINSDLRVLHGMLTSARSIPKDFKDRQPFLLIRDPEDNERGVLLDADSDGCKELASEIEKVLGSEEIATFFIDIEHVYILYGYELSLVLSVDEDDLDEEIIIDCIEVGDAARKLNEDD